MTEAIENVHQSAEYLVARELGALLRVTDKTISRWAAQDPSMPCLRIGGTTRFPRERVLRWLAQREQGRARPRRKAS